MAASDTLFGVADVLCHEIVHQYFGDLVTADSWGDLFLHESFATFFSTFMLAKFHPENAEFLVITIANSDLLDRYHLL